MRPNKKSRAKPTGRPVSEKQLAANRENGKKSRGPKTQAGKDKVRLNATKHGLCAKTLLLPGEDANALEARLLDWRAAVGPRSAVEAFLVDDAVAASWRLDRCRRNDTAILSKQVREAEGRFDAEADDALDALVARLPAEPARVARELRRTARGCAWAAAALEALVGTLEARGWWTPTERDRVLYLLGRRTEDVFLDGLAYDIMRAFLAAGWSTQGEALRVQGLIRKPAPEGMGTFEYRNLVEGLAEAVKEADPELARAELVALLRPEAEALARRAEALAPREALDRAGAGDRAAVDVSPGGHSRARYEAARRRDFRGALRDLIAVRKNLKPDEFGQVVPDTPGPIPVAPNEPISAPGPAPLPLPRAKAEGHRGPRLAAPDLMGPSLQARAALGVPTDRHLHPHNPFDPQPEDLRRFADELEAGIHDWVYDDEPPGTLPHH